MLSRRRLLIVLGSVVAVACTSCAQPDPEEQRRVAEVKGVAKAFLDGVPSSPDKDKAKWGMSEFYFFGPITLWGADQIEAARQGDSPRAYRAVAHVWRRGKTPDGQTATLKDTVALTVVADGSGQGWRVDGYELSEEAPLSFWEPLWFWLFWSYGGPVVVWWFAVAWFDWLLKYGPIGIPFLVLFALGSVVWSGVVAYNGFGSVLAVFLCIPVYVVTNLFLFCWFFLRKKK